MRSRTPQRASEHFERHRSGRKSRHRLSKCSEALRGVGAPPASSWVHHRVDECVILCIGAALTPWEKGRLGSAAAKEDLPMLRDLKVTALRKIQRTL